MSRELAGKGFRRWIRKSQEWLHQVAQSIAFVPALLCLLFALLVWGALWLEQTWVDQLFAKHLNWTQLESEETARGVLGIIAGGTISLMVFSFSMVMVVLNRASSDFSPRLLPGLISSRDHQLVLGVYLGTIIYTLILMFNIRSAQNNYEIPSLGILGAVLLMIVCVFLFVFFIHNISRSIQIEGVLKRLYSLTQAHLKPLAQRHTALPPPLEILHHTVPAPTSGYLQAIMQTALVEFCAQHDLILSLQVVQGDFVLSGSPLCHCNRDLSQTPELIEVLQNHFVFYEGQLIQDNYIFGFRQLSEIAVKALSPGINDPATAISVIEHFSVLLRTYLEVEEFQVFVDQQQAVRLIVRHLGLAEMLQRIVQPIRHYGREDVWVLERLLWLSQSLMSACKHPSQCRVLQDFGNQLVETARQHIYLESDRRWLNQQLNLWNQQCNPEQGLSLL